MKIVLCTAPVETAERLASTLVEERVAACVNVLPGVASIYRWQGKIERAEESLLVAKTGDAALARLMSRIAELHPYSTPEIVAVDASSVADSYLAWVDAETSR
jgi:periplasmic divalent cation tolerance protein